MSWCSLEGVQVAPGGFLVISTWCPVHRPVISSWSLGGLVVSWWLFGVVAVSWWSPGSILVVCSLRVVSWSLSGLLAVRGGVSWSSCAVGVSWRSPGLVVLGSLSVLILVSWWFSLVVSFLVSRSCVGGLLVIPGSLGGHFLSWWSPCFVATVSCCLLVFCWCRGGILVASCFSNASVSYCKYKSRRGHTGMRSIANFRPPYCSLMRCYSRLHRQLQQPENLRPRAWGLRCRGLGFRAFHFDSLPWPNSP